jgi:hypothetical protein
MEFKIIEGGKSKHGGLQIMKFKLSKHFHRCLFMQAFQKHMLACLDRTTNTKASLKLQEWWQWPASDELKR